MATVTPLRRIEFSTSDPSEAEEFLARGNRKQALVSYRRALALDAAANAVVITDREGLIVWVNAGPTGGVHQPWVGVLNKHGFKAKKPKGSFFLED